MLAPRGRSWEQGKEVTLRPGLVLHVFMWVEQIPVDVFILSLSENKPKGEPAWGLELPAPASRPGPWGGSSLGCSPSGSPPHACPFPLSFEAHMEGR